MNVAMSKNRLQTVIFRGSVKMLIFKFVIVSYRKNVNS